MDDHYRVCHHCDGNVFRALVGEEEGWGVLCTYVLFFSLLLWLLFPYLSRKTETVLNHKTRSGDFRGTLEWLKCFNSVRGTNRACWLGLAGDLEIKTRRPCAKPKKQICSSHKVGQHLLMYPTQLWHDCCTIDPCWSPRDLSLVNQTRIPSNRGHWKGKNVADLFRGLGLGSGLHCDNRLQYWYEPDMFFKLGCAQLQILMVD